MNTISSSQKKFAADIIDEFSIKLGGIQPSYRIKSRPDGDFLIVEFAKPNSRFYTILDEIENELPSENEFRGKCLIGSRLKKPDAILAMPETQLLQKAIAESMTVDRYSFGEDFFARYTPSVTNFEKQVVSNANYIIYGRRGAGKSSMLAYAMHTAVMKGLPFSWVAMQTYEARKDDNVIPSVIAEILGEAKKFAAAPAEFEKVIEVLIDLSESFDADVQIKLDRITPRIKRLLYSIATVKIPFTIFLDDFHVVSEELQPKLLSAIYALSRGNNTYIKLSGVEQFTRTWNSSTRQGLQPPHDAQALTLDYNLTMPDRSKVHIVSILDSHARFCGLPDIAYLASDAVLSRVVLEAAAVPRDSLGLFTQAITKAFIREQKTISLMSVNAAASEMAEGKLKDIQKDTNEDQVELISVLDRIKVFCITDKRTNSFLVRIKNDDKIFQYVQKLIALRLIHVLHEGITPHEAGQRYMALMLDYGFYIGIRAAKSVKLFPTEPKALLAKDLRKLPIFQLTS